MMSEAKRVLELHEQLVGEELPTIGQVLHVVIVDDEQITELPERSSKPRVGSQLVRLVVVLDEAAELEIGREVEPEPPPE